MNRLIQITKPIKALAFGKAKKSWNDVALFQEKN